VIELEDKNNNIEKENQNEEIKVEKELDREAFQVIIRLYDKTFRILADK